MEYTTYHNVWMMPLYYPRSRKWRMTKKRERNELACFSRKITQWTGRRKQTRRICPIVYNARVKVRNRNVNA